MFLDITNLTERKNLRCESGTDIHISIKNVVPVLGDLKPDHGVL
jgi:hypothetical protein